MRRRQVLTATLSRQANIRAVPVNLSLPVMLWINLGCQMGELLSPPLRGDPRHRDDGTIRSVKCQPRLWCRGQLTDKCRLRVILSRHGWPLPTVPSRRPPAWPRRDIIDHPGLSLPVCPMPPSHLLGPRRKASVNLQYATRVSIFLDSCNLETRASTGLLLAVRISPEVSCVHTIIVYTESDSVRK